LTEVTATERTSIARFTFPEGQANILLNLGEGLTNESGAWMRRISDTEIEGMKLLGTFCYNPQAVFPVYFVMRINRQPSASGYGKDSVNGWIGSLDSTALNELYTRNER
jgi:putative alpha-1,2-mannosidase